SGKAPPGNGRDNKDSRSTGTGSGNIQGARCQRADKRRGATPSIDRRRPCQAVRTDERIIEENRGAATMTREKQVTRAQLFMSSPESRSETDLEFSSTLRAHESAVGATR